jgi:hypothetical protein
VLLSAAAATPPSAPTKQDKNVVLYGRNIDPTTFAVVDGTLTYATGGVATESLVPRVCAIVGRDATLRGVAAVIKPILDKSTSTTPKQSVDDIAKALYTYNSAYLADPTTGTPMAQWRVGLRLTLPIEIDLGSNPATPVEQHLVVNRAQMAAWTTAFGTTPTNLLDKKAPTLPFPTGSPNGSALPVKLDAARDAALATLGTGSITAVAQTYVPRLLANPYEVVFEFVEAVRQLRLTNQADELQFVLDVAENFTTEQAYTIGTLTAGHAALRRMWDTLSGRVTPPSADQTRYDTARQVVAFGARLHFVGPMPVWDSPEEYGPDVAPIEPPLQAGKPIATSTKQVITVSVLGREVDVGKTASIQTGWHGPDNAGSWKLNSTTPTVAPIVAQITAAAFPSPTVKRQACLDVVTRIAVNEGGYDAVQMADKGVLSVGLQQWTIAANNELTVLLHKFKKTNPEHYDLFIGMYGLQPRLWAGISGGAEKPGATAADISAANKYDASSVPTTASDYGDDIATYVALDEVPRNAPKDPLTAGTKRVNFLGTQADTDLKRNWCARFRLATQCSLDWNVIELQVAVFRFQRLLDDYKSKTFNVVKPSQGLASGFSGNHAVTELFPSPFAAALLFDQHINAPNRGPQNVTDAIAMAITYGPPPYEMSGTTVTTTLDPTFLTHLSFDFLATRYVFGKVFRDGNIADQFDKTLTSDVTGFHGW